MPPNAMKLRSIEARDAEADGASMAIDVWDSYHAAPAEKKDAEAEEAAFDFVEAHTNYPMKSEQAAFATGFFRQMLELTQIPRPGR